MGGIWLGRMVTVPTGGHTRDDVLDSGSPIVAGPPNLSAVPVTGCHRLAPIWTIENSEGQVARCAKGIIGSHAKKTEYS